MQERNLDMVMGLKFKSFNSENIITEKYLKQWIIKTQLEFFLNF